VALKALQRRLHSSAPDDSHSLDDVSQLQGALHQASAQYRQLLEQFVHVQHNANTHRSTAVELTHMQVANDALTEDLNQSQMQLKHSQQHLEESKKQLQQSKEQLRQHAQESDRLQQLVEKLSKAAAEMHAVIKRVDASGRAQAAVSLDNRHNLQAVHTAVQNKLSRYDSKSSDSDFSSTELLLPALWKPQRERHIPPSGFQ